MRIAGIIVAAIGFLVLQVLGHNYGTCQSPWVDASQAGCRYAFEAHSWGIIILVAGVILFAIGLVTHRRAP